MAFDKLGELEKYRDSDDRMTAAIAFSRENDTIVLARALLFNSI